MEERGIQMKIEFYKDNYEHKAKLSINNESKEDFELAIKTLLDKFVEYIKNHVNNDSSTYTLFFCVNGVTKSEEDFWHQVIHEYKLEGLAKQYFNKLLTVIKTYKPVWSDEENSLIRKVVLSLAHYSPKNLELYNDFNKWHDMDHEVNEYEDIEMLIDTYGLCEGTLEIISTRAGIACGQHGLEQLEYCIKKKGLKHYLSHYADLEDFIFRLFLEKYLEFYMNKMKKEHSWIWPLKYSNEAFSDFIDLIIEDEQVSSKYVNKGHDIIIRCYKENQLY